jgi:hypothetical protein
MRTSKKQYRRNRVTVLRVLLGVMITATIAAAQPPGNDDIANATVVTEVPFTDGPIDTSEATAAADDPQDCTSAGSTIWYMFTPTADLSIEINTFDSDYDTTLGVYTGSPGSLSLITCNDDFDGLQSAVHFEATANTTYFIMVADHCCESTGGVTLFFNIREFDFPPRVDIALVVAQGSFNKAGEATIGGTVTCNIETFDGIMYGTLRQRVGRDFITGDFFIGLDSPCVPPSSNWSATVVGDGVFRGGKVNVEVFAEACDDFTCDSDEVRKTIYLKGKK